MTDTNVDRPKDETTSITSRPVSGFIHIVFFWCLGGISVVYGVRLYHDLPVHPSFLPIIGAAFAAVLSFALVMALRQIEGPVDIELGKFHLKGAGGPIVLWCVCFVTVAYGLYLLGIIDAVKAPPTASYQSCSAVSAMFKECSAQRAKPATP